MAQINDGERLRRYWDGHAPSYDRQIGFLERRLFGNSRAWICSRATGDVLDVAIGTGLNLPFYAADVRLTGVEWSPAMLDIARRRARDLNRGADLREGDAQALPFPDASFDTVVCTLALCAIPDDRAAVAEMTRVLRPGGLLLLLDHVAAGPWPARVVQRLLELVTIRVGGEHFTRRPLHHVQAAGLDIEERHRFKLGIMEQLAARRPAMTETA
jgi:ubiquinone/menaquinone biosynthesis C-methylase UbiE